jgi:hypothetical protein
MFEGIAKCMKIVAAILEAIKKWGFIRLKNAL